MRQFIISLVTLFIMGTGMSFGQHNVQVSHKPQITHVVKHDSHKHVTEPKHKTCKPHKKHHKPDCKSHKQVHHKVHHNGHKG